MESYIDIGSDSGVASFEIAADSISIKFSKTDRIYKYTYLSAGSKNIEAMKILAKSGIRNIVGLDVSVAQEAFAGFIQAGSLKADQMTFINNIISYLSKNGMIDKAMLFEPPFTNIHQDGLIGVFDEASAKTVIQLVSAVNENALVKFA